VPRGSFKGQKRERVGKCAECNRTDVETLPNGKLGFHYAVHPGTNDALSCGLQCAGGRVSYALEDRPDRVHSKKACPKCAQ
jgi:hypothetical protein